VRAEAAAVVVAVAEPVSASVLAAEVVVVGVAAVAGVAVPASANTLAHRKAKRLRKYQRESLYPHLVGDHYCDLPIPTHSHL